MKECDACQMNEYEAINPAGLLQPLPIPTSPWTDISQDFVEGLPLSNGFCVVFSVIDRLTKHAILFPFSHLYTNIKVAQVFFVGVFKLHGMPKSAVSNRDAAFTSSFWKELFQLQGTTLAFSYAYHPQTDGQTESLNKCLEANLRCYSGTKPNG